MAAAPFPAPVDEAERFTAQSTCLNGVRHPSGTSVHLGRNPQVGDQGFHLTGNAQATEVPPFLLGCQRLKLRLTGLRPGRLLTQRQVIIHRLGTLIRQIVIPRFRVTFCVAACDPDLQP
jgi:hypothetical protein